MTTAIKQKNIYENSIKNWPKDERPREKLFRYGEHTLSNTELLAILLRSGFKGQSAVDLYARIHCLNDMLSQGVHEGIELNDVNICVIDTYLLIGSFISLVPIKNTEIGF